MMALYAQGIDWAKNIASCLSGDPYEHKQIRTRPPRATPPPRRVYLSARSFQDPLTGKPLNLQTSEDGIHRCSAIVALGSDGAVHLADGTVLHSIDTIIFCTGECC